LEKAKDANPNGKKWYSQLVIAESRQYTTKLVSDPDEALVQYGMILLFRKSIHILDILKVKHCLDHVKQSPLIAQRLIFQYGLVRPLKFVKKGCYKDINTLIINTIIKDLVFLTIVLSLLMMGLLILAA